MEQAIDYDELEAALRRCGSTWEVAQAHGLLCSRLATEGAPAGQAWLEQVLDGVDAGNAARAECEAMLIAVHGSSYQQLSERQSAFNLMLPDEYASTSARAEALGHWCEGYLHGLVSGQRNDKVRERLSVEPLADLIKDMLQITRAAADDEGADDETEAAYVELVEYVRVAAQLAFEELADVRDGKRVTGKSPDALH
ncbi:MAG: UPF0149 family protein, partial [Woeseia sp.]